MTLFGGLLMLGGIAALHNAPSTGQGLFMAAVMFAAAARILTLRGKAF